jgi:hypothetical protein
MFSSFERVTGGFTFRSIKTSIDMQSMLYNQVCNTK